jgi:hypothetical protein
MGGGMYDQVGLFANAGGACGYLAAWGDEVGAANAAETAWCFGKSLDTLYRSAICAHVSQVLQREAGIAANNYWMEEGLPYEGSYGGSPPDGSRGNAVLHMMYSGLIALFYGGSIAEQLTNAHEMHETLGGAVQDQMNVQMDLSNNFYGRTLGRRALSPIDLAYQVRLFVNAGLACERTKGDGNVGNYVGGFVRPERCGIP